MPGTRPHANCPPATATDRELLQAFVSQQSEPAFRRLVERHSRLVGGVCGRVLRNVAAVEDACQATFLVLAGRASALLWTLGESDSLAPWLYRVALNAAIQIKRNDRSRQRIEQEFVRRRVSGENEAEVWNGVAEILDEEIGALPRRFQEPLVLCHLEGKTQQAAAEELSISQATIRRRLETAKELLRNRLTRRGVTVSGVVLASLLWRTGPVSAAPAPIASGALAKAATLQGAANVAQLKAAGLVSVNSVNLSQQVLAMYSLFQLKALTAAAVVALSLVTGGFFAWRTSTADAAPPRKTAPAVAATQPAAAVTTTSTEAPAETPAGTNNPTATPETPPAEKQSPENSTAEQQPADAAPAEKPAAKKNQPARKSNTQSNKPTGAAGSDRRTAGDKPAKSTAKSNAKSSTKSRRSAPADAADVLNDQSGNGLLPANFFGGGGARAGGQSGGSSSSSTHSGGSAGGLGVSSQMSIVNGKFVGKVTVNGVEQTYDNERDYQAALKKAQQAMANTPMPGFPGLPGFPGGQALGGGNAMAGGGGHSLSSSSSIVNGKFVGKITINGVETVYKNEQEYKQALAKAQREANAANPLQGLAPGFPLLPGFPGGAGAAAGGQAIAGGQAGGNAGGSGVSVSSSKTNGEFTGRITVDGEETVYDDEAEFQERLQELRQDGRLPK
ncbi:MAG: sigma-70 family RNA polymerase sigma factor [Planctomycetes bacterium]|nr:sigma-70 family RNA polymerase sigma factor [Planctomycetota bacterium]